MLLTCTVHFALLYFSCLSVVTIMLIVLGCVCMLVVGGIGSRNVWVLVANTYQIIYKQNLIKDMRSVKHSKMCKNISNSKRNTIFNRNPDACHDIKKEYNNEKHHNYLVNYIFCCNMSFCAYVIYFRKMKFDMDLQLTHLRKINWCDLQIEAASRVCVPSRGVRISNRYTFCLSN